MAEYGIALAHRPTHVDTVRRRRFDLVVSVCDRAREVCPEFPGRPGLIHWSIQEPARDDDGGPPAYRRTATELDNRIGHLLRGLVDTP